MRPVNLIPSEQRHGQRAPMRGGPLAYILIAALVAALAGVTLLVVTDNQISERKTEIVQVEREDAAAKARAAQAEADIKTAQAKGLAQQAAGHRTEAVTSRDDLNERFDRADALDPTTAASDTRSATHDEPHPTTGSR